jgi:hypothetical protein
MAKTYHKDYEWVIWRCGKVQIFLEQIRTEWMKTLRADQIRKKLAAIRLKVSSCLLSHLKAAAWSHAPE